MKYSPKRRWTAEDDAVLRQDISLGEMAKRLNRTYAAVARRRQELHTKGQL